MNAAALPQLTARDTLTTALALALGSAVSLGLARFSYALLLPAMRADLGWSYFTAGAMNAVNAAGYLAGALAAPALMRRRGARAALVGGGVLAALTLALHGLVAGDAALYALRFATGTASAFTFVAGGLMAARLSTQGAAGSGITPGLVLGIYYGGTGLGIVACAALLPPLLAAPIAGVRPGGPLDWPSGWLSGWLSGWPSGWQTGWLVLAALSLLGTAVMAWRALVAEPPAAATAHASRFDPRPFAHGLAGYFMFGLGYIGYMTFNVTLLREQQMGAGTISAFYALLGLGVMASPWLWAGLLQRQRGGGALARLSALLALATALPVLVAHPAVALASGALFGAVFLSLVASTTALVRHNLPPAAWAQGISAFTVVFAAGQIIGPGLVGRLSDGVGGLRAGLAVSAAALALGALLAWRQRPLPHAALQPGSTRP